VKPRGSLALVLHAHLPFVRHPESAAWLEERWLFEAVTETYLPLLDVLEALERDRLDVVLTVSISPTLLAMLTDRLLRARYLVHLDALVQLSEREERRTRAEPLWHRCAQLYLHRLIRTRSRLLDHWHQDVAGAFRAFQERGRIELFTTAATHAILPLLASSPEWIRAQIKIGMAEYRRYFGRPSAGFWLPECAFGPGLDVDLARAGVRWVVLDTHGLTHATPQPVYGAYAPVVSPAGVAAFARDPDSATQVWSAQVGYPADPWYRDFHRDIGFDLPAAWLHPLTPGDHRTPTGLKYHRITGDTWDKQPYDPDRAAERVAAHAAHFVQSRLAQIDWLCRTMDRPPVVVCPYDAELFGHWWFEGVEWLDAILRRIAATPELGTTTLSAEIDRHPVLQRAMPAASTWGSEGHHAVWLNRANEWIYPHLHATARRLTRLGRMSRRAVGLPARALGQAVREMLLAQGSDWAFMMARRTTADYASRRTVEHLRACQQLCDAVEAGVIDEIALATLEEHDALFPVLDLGVLD
jgi:1,4-alpha-glucan branching enzyme